MARLKQLEPKKETIGGLNFYIRPFPAMVAANLTGDLASLLTPVLAALMPLVGNSDNESDGEDGDLMDIDVNDAAASISKSMEGFSGSKVESMMKKLLIAHKNVVVELPVMDEDDVETGEYSQEILDMDIVNEIFCGDVQNMFILAFYVICFKLRLLPYATYNFPILFSNLPVVPIGQHFLLSCSTSHSGSFFKWCHKMKPACFEFVSIKSKAVSEDVSHNCNFLFWCVSIH